jgi:serine/threonine protein kinase/Tfp pilus assembly protein PilF
MAVKCPKCQAENPETKQFCGDCGTQLIPSEKIPSRTETLEAPVQELTTGSTFAKRYQIIEELGKGGMGKVYKVFDQEVQAKMALKLIKPEISADKNTIDRFRNELKIARDVSHKNICRMYDLGREAGSYFITMEYVSGEDLKSFIRRSRQLVVGTAIFIAKQVCDGLAEAHRVGVVHRDLKPSNIMIDKEGNAKIMDFGIARSISVKGITGAGVMIGTPEYMSPEQVEGKEVDQRSDIYSLGIILYEMLTGQVPFEGDTPLSVAVKQKTETPRNPRTINPQVPEDLSGTILKCLEKEKEKRYQTAGDLLADLEKIEKGIPTAERIIPRKERFTSREITVKFNLKKLAFPAIAVIALAVAAVLLWKFIPHKKEPAAAKIANSIAVISFKNQTGDQAFDYLQEAIPNLLITNLENTGLFYVATWERMQDILKQMGVKQARIIDSDLGFELCRREGIKAIAIGSFTKAGDVFRTDVKILDAESKQLLKSANIKGTGVNSILDSQIDALSREMSLGLGIETAKIDRAPLSIKDITTQSLEAYDYFLKGKEAYSYVGWEDARQKLQKALEIDPTFAMAYVYLAWTEHHLNNLKARNETLEKAMALSNRTSDKDRLYLDATYAIYVKDDGEKFLTIMKELIRKYPKEKSAYYHLGDFLMEYRQDWAGAEAQFKKWLELDPRDVNAINHLLHVAVIKGDYEKAAEYIKTHDAVAPPDAYSLWQQAQMYENMGQLDKAIAKNREALQISPDHPYCLLALTRLYALKEDYEESLRWANEAISRASSAGWKTVAYGVRGLFFYWVGDFQRALDDFNISGKLAEEVEDWESRLGAEESKGTVYLAQGEFELSRKCYEEALRIAEERFPKDVPLHKIALALRLAQIALTQGQIGQANAGLSELKSLLPTVDKGSQDSLIYWHDLLQGEVLLAQGSLDAALSISAKAFQTKASYREFGEDVRWQFRDLPARIYAKKGEVGKAIEEYERLLSEGASSGAPGPVYPPHHYRLGILYEKAGQAAKAKAQYQKFLEIWKNADPRRPEVEDAQKRLAGLQI